jgi:hypothetical protein
VERTNEAVGIGGWRPGYYGVHAWHGFLVAAGEYLRENHAALFRDEKKRNRCLANRAMGHVKLLFCLLNFSKGSLDF